MLKFFIFPSLIFGVGPETRRWKIMDAKRTYNLQSAVVQTEVTATFKNTGSTKSDSLLIGFEDGPKTGKISFVKAVVDDKKSTNAVNSITRAPGDGTRDVTFFKVELATGIPGGKTIKLKYSGYLGRAYQPLPKEMVLFQKQMLIFHAPLYVPTSYSVEEQETSLVLMSEQALENFEPEAKRVGDVIKWGPYSSQNFSELDDVPELKVHFPHVDHQGYFKEVRREIEVSHWGNVAFREDYELHNAGAKLKGAFNRVPFTMYEHLKRRGESLDGKKRKDVPAATNPETSSLQEVNLVLPRTARNIHYRDDIGNISSSHARRDDRGYVLVQLHPRYPMLGGSNADWKLSYDVPTKTALKVDTDDPGLHVLNITMSPPVVRTFTSKLVAEVVLPEGAYDIQLKAPQYIEKQWIGKRYSWLDYFGGRPYIGYEVDNFFVPERNILQYKFQVTYRFNNFLVFREGILVSFFLFLAFLLFIGSQRFRLRIARDDEKATMLEKEQDVVIVQNAMDFFDALLSEVEVYARACEKNQHYPKKNFEQYATKQKENMELAYVNLKQKMDKHSDPVKAGKLMSAVRQYLDTQKRRSEGIPTPDDNSPVDEPSSSASGLTKRGSKNQKKGLEAPTSSGSSGSRGDNIDVKTVEWESQIAQAFHDLHSEAETH